MRRNEMIYADTHASFLNKVFKTNYKAWMKSVYMHNNDFIWMVRLDGTLRDGWKNTFCGEEIKEENTFYNRDSWDGIELPYYQTFKRVVFSITETPRGRAYTFLGVYEYEAEKSNPYRVRNYKRVSDEYNA